MQLMMPPVQGAVSLRTSFATRSKFTPLLSDSFSVKVLLFPRLTKI